MGSGVEETVEEHHPFVFCLEDVIHQVISCHIKVKNDRNNRYLKLLHRYIALS